MWASTRDQIVDLFPGMAVTRAVDILTLGFNVLGHDRHKAAIKASSGDASEFQPQLVWSETFYRIDQIRLATALEKTRIFDVMVEGWKLLDDDERQDAIRRSMQETPDPRKAVGS